MCLCMVALILGHVYQTHALMNHTFNMMLLRSRKPHDRATKRLYGYH